MVDRFCCNGYRSMTREKTPTLYCRLCSAYDVQMDSVALVTWKTMSFYLSLSVTIVCLLRKDPLQGLFVLFTKSISVAVVSGLLRFSVGFPKFINFNIFICGLPITSKLFLMTHSVFSNDYLVLSFGSHRLLCRIGQSVFRVNLLSITCCLRNVNLRQPIINPDRNSNRLSMITLYKSNKFSEKSRTCRNIL